MVSENSSSQAATKKRILVADRKADESKRKKLAAELDKKKKILFSPSLPAPRQGMDCREGRHRRMRQSSPFSLSLDPLGKKKVLSPTQLTTRTAHYCGVVVAASVVSTFGS